MRISSLLDRGCLTVESATRCQVEVSAKGWSIVQGIPTVCGVSLSETRYNSIPLDLQCECKTGQNKKGINKEWNTDRNKDGYTFLAETICLIFINITSRLLIKTPTSTIIYVVCVSKSSNVIYINQYNVIFSPLCVWEGTGITWLTLLRRIQKQLNVVNYVFLGYSLTKFQDNLFGATQEDTKVIILGVDLRETGIGVPLSVEPFLLQPCTESV